jgi:hypothetical protein
MSHAQLSGPPRASASDAGLVALVLRWLVPGILIAIGAVLWRGISHTSEEKWPDPVGAQPIVVAGETPTRDELDDRLTVDLYDVTDLVPAGSATSSIRDACQGLVDLIESSVLPDLWEPLSGPGRISPMRLEDSRLLSIVQTEQGHEGVANFLAVLRRARHKVNETERRPIVVPPDDSPATRANERIRQILDKPVRFDCEGQRLDEALGALGRRMGVFIRLLEQDIADHGIAIDYPVTVHLRRVTGLEALKSILEPFQLMWVIEDGMLKIAGPGCEGPIMEVYDVAEFVSPTRGDDGSVRYDAESLAKTIKTMVRPEEWDMSFAEIREFHAERIHVLVIRQTYSAHQEIADFLESLRTARRKPSRSQPGRGGG